jgi:hypothetical protein
MPTHSLLSGQALKVGATFVRNPQVASVCRPGVTGKRLVD